ncbi:MAG: DUF72 domain-containing protein [Candidatus Hydrogenedentes bacterium]|nr:DUF72 domain-containing protein [Candidatus Hydrogenedentota bacterium]
MTEGRLFVGTSGWSYPHWGRGVFYPKTVPTQKWLEYYADKFSAVEVNSTFYRLPSPSLLKRWVEVTPNDFCFVIKIWRRLSHELRLRETENALKEFWESVKPIIVKAPVFLLQMPPSYVPDIDQMDKFFDQWFDLFPGVRLALELRNKKAFGEEVFDFLGKRCVCLVLEDYRGCEIEDVITTDWVYIRRHGPSGRYRGEYDEIQLERDARKIGNWLKRGMDVYVFFNNDFGGYAPKNALQLISLVRSGRSVKRDRNPKNLKEI